MKHGLQLLLWTLPMLHSETRIGSSNQPFKKSQVDTDTISMTRMPILRHLRPGVHLPLMLFRFAAAQRERRERESKERERLQQHGQGDREQREREKREQQECVQREREECECWKREREEHEREEHEREERERWEWEEWQHQEQEEREHRERERREQEKREHRRRPPEVDGQPVFTNRPAGQRACRERERQLINFGQAWDFLVAGHPNNFHNQKCVEGLNRCTCIVSSVWSVGGCVNKKNMGTNIFGHKMYNRATLNTIH
ncbi:hypothetical protein K438DRAFT_1762051 [Mycena galopus ATCC 62051]|nr:hypothetical protein K438DRAFT_1762051 [Mycena galopus ATCC 62051]